MFPNDKDKRKKKNGETTSWKNPSTPKPRPNAQAKKRAALVKERQDLVAAIEAQKLKAEGIKGEVENDEGLNSFADFITGVQQVNVRHLITPYQFTIDICAARLPNAHLRYLCG